VSTSATKFWIVAVGVLIVVVAVGLGIAALWGVGYFAA
jgi:succinate dehydrogenase hydrophobic anchor subunit